LVTPSGIKNPKNTLGKFAWISVTKHIAPAP
jgi:hypothetical protein